MRVWKTVLPGSVRPRRTVSLAEPSFRVHRVITGCHIEPRRGFVSFTEHARAYYARRRRRASTTRSRWNTRILRPSRYVSKVRPFPSRVIALEFDRSNRERNIASSATISTMYQSLEWRIAEKVGRRRKMRVGEKGKGSTEDDAIV